jgi:hypothetical protein
LPALLGVAACAALLTLYSRWLFEPHIRYDDFQFLTRSRTWNDAAAHLWLPVNDHAMPLPRLLAAVLMDVVPGQSFIPLAAQLQGVLAVVIGMWLLYVFVRRELGHPSYALIAMIGWGVTTAYYECVTWYSASFFIFSLDTTLVALLAAQSWRRSGRWSSLAVCVIGCALASAWYAGGILAGVFCVIYLLGSRVREHQSPRIRFRLPIAIAAPLAGSALFLAISLPLTAGRIVHAEHYGFLQLPLGFEGENVRELLRGSPTPVDMSVQQARALLNQ